MKEKRIYMVHVDDIPENESFVDWTDDRVIETAEKRGTVYSLEGFVEQWNESTNFIDSPDYSYMRIIEAPKGIIGFQVYEKDTFPEDMPDWWVFYCKEEAEVYAKWSEFEQYEIEAVFEDEIEEPEIISFNDYIYSQVLSNFDNGSKYEDILLWLRDYGIPKTRAHNITERILQYYNS